MPGVTISWMEGIAKTTTTDGSGNYSITVQGGWSGSVTPSLTGYTFTPAVRSYSSISSDQLNQDYTVAPTVYTISGNAGIGSAVLSWTDGTAKTTTADGTGLYSFTVSYNWSGTVTPSLSSHSFTPANRTYSNVLSDQTAQNYTASANFLIVGKTSVGNVTLSWDNNGPQTVTSTVDGDYIIEIPAGWSGTVTPSLAGYTFSPVNYTYTNAASNFLNQNYTASAILYTISGNTGVGGVTLSWDDVAFAPAVNGNIKQDKIKISSSDNIKSDPVNTAGSKQKAGITSTGKNINDTGLKTSKPNAPAAPTIVKTVVSNPDGSYSFTVSYNWSGTVTPSLAGYTFTPANIAYTNVLTDQPNQDYAAAPILYTISGNSGKAGAVLSWFDGTAKTITSDGSGVYSFTVSYNWSGIVTPSFTGYAFTPANKVYTNLLADSIDQNYAASQLPASVVGYWNLNESAGGTFSDLTGVNNGTGNVSPTPSAGQVSGAQLFDGSTTKIDVPANTSLDFTAAGNFSVEFWYKGSTLLLLLINVAVSRVISGSAYWWVGIAGGTGKAYFSMYIGGTAVSVFGNVITDGIMASCCCY